MKTLKSLWWILTLPCEEASRIASDERDRELSRLERTALRAHLVSCGKCKRFRRQIEVIHKASESVPEMPEDARRRIQSRISGEED